MEYRVRRRYDAQHAPISQAQRRLPRPDPISDALVRRFLLRAGFRASTNDAVAHVRQYTTELLEKLLESMVAFMAHDRCMRFRLVHVMNACRVHGIRLYGFDDVCELEHHGAIESYHVTEMVEMNTAFGGPEQQDDEPDIEPGARFSKTDFVANYTARMAEYEDNDSDDGDENDDSEWSWYGESDADSDSDSDSECEIERVDDDNQVETEEDVEMDSDAHERELKPWQRPLRENQFIESLKVAQGIVDDQLVCTDGSDDDDADDDANAPQGQGYDSDRDATRESAAAFRYTQAIEREDALWDTSRSIHEVGDDFAAHILDAIQAGANTQQYVMSRQAFATLLRSTMDRYSYEISSVALSALHNATEQQLHHALTGSVLGHELQAMIRKAQTAQQQLELEAALAMEREKVTERDHTIAELTAALKAKELAMQHQIAQLQQQLSTQQHSSNNNNNEDDDDVQMQTPTRTPKKPTPKKRKSPGKRKVTASSTHGEVVRKETTPKPSIRSKSLVGSLRSKIQDYALRTKKVRVNPM